MRNSPEPSRAKRAPTEVDAALVLSARAAAVIAHAELVRCGQTSLKDELGVEALRNVKQFLASAPRNIRPRVDIGKLTTFLIEQHMRAAPSNLRTRCGANLPVGPPWQERC